MFALARVAATASAFQARVWQEPARLYSGKPKTNALKAKEKSKLRRLRINKPDAPAQAKRNVRVSKL
ncbi:hypothetical protein H4S08_004576 [Coemansia sp. RSA 1365]|nr:hypothetical protein H4S08_004576 [Coemansia sp. RSA 1365]